MQSLNILERRQQINCSHEEVRSSLNSRTCYHVVQTSLLSCWRSKNARFKIYKIIISSVVLYEFETWSLMLRQEHRLGVSENKNLKRKYGALSDKVIRE